MLCVTTFLSKCLVLHRWAWYREKSRDTSRSRGRPSGSSSPCSSLRALPGPRLSQEPSPHEPRVVRKSPRGQPESLEVSLELSESHPMCPPSKLPPPPDSLGFVRSPCQEFGTGFAASTSPVLESRPLQALVEDPPSPR